MTKRQIIINQLQTTDNSDDLIALIADCSVEYVRKVWLEYKKTLKS